MKFDIVIFIIKLHHQERNSYSILHRIFEVITKMTGEHFMKYSFIFFQQFSNQSVYLFQFFIQTVKQGARHTIILFSYTLFSIFFPSSFSYENFIIFFFLLLTYFSFNIWCKFLSDLLVFKLLINENYNLLFSAILLKIVFFSLFLQIQKKEDYSNVYILIQRLLICTLRIMCIYILQNFCVLTDGLIF